MPTLPLWPLKCVFAGKRWSNSCTDSIDDELGNCTLAPGWFLFPGCLLPLLPEVPVPVQLTHNAAVVAGDGLRTSSAIDAVGLFCFRMLGFTKPFVDILMKRKFYMYVFTYTNILLLIYIFDLYNLQLYLHLQ